MAKTLTINFAIDARTARQTATQFFNDLIQQAQQTRTIKLDADATAFRQTLRAAEIDAERSAQAYARAFKTANDKVRATKPPRPEPPPQTALGDAFQRTRKQLQELEREQKAAIAQLILSGQAGTAEFAKLEKELEKTTQRLKEIKTAAQAAGIDKAPPPPKSPKPEPAPLTGNAALADSFLRSKRELEAFHQTQKAAFAQLISDGKQGTAEYKRLQAEIKDTERELHKVGKAVEQSGLGQQTKISTSAFRFNQITDAAQTISDSMQGVINVGVEFQASLAAVGAITGFSGAELDKLGNGARELAIQFGGSATSQLKSFQGILSKLGPQVAEDAEALKLLGRNVNILSAASGDDAATSMNAIVDTMLQLGLVSGDAAKDAETSTRVINALAASAKVGAAEIPQVAQSLLQAGVAAKGANLSLESVNAAIQVLAVGGKTGSEAGVALRNVLGLIQKASGPAENALAGMGTSSQELGEILTTQGLGPALQKLRDGMNGLGTDAQRNATLMTIFGTENSAAAGILLENIDKLAEFEAGIIEGQQGIGDAFVQAEVRMDTVESKMSRFAARMKDLAISAFGTIGDGLAGFVGILGQAAPALATLSNIKLLIPTDLKIDTDKIMAPLQKRFEGVATAFGTPVKQRLSEALSGALDPKDAGARLRTALGSIFSDGAKVAGKELGGIGKGISGLSGVAKQAGTGIASGFKGIAGFLGPTAPWILGITAAVGLFTLLYNKSEKFKAAVDGFVSKIKAGFDKVVAAVGPIFEQVLGILGEIGSLLLDILITPTELWIDALTGIGDVIGGWLAPLVGAGDAAGFFQKIMEGIELVLVGIKSSIAGVKAGWEAMKQSIGDGFDKLFSGDVIGAVQSFSSVGQSASDAFNQALQEGIEKGATEIVARHLKETIENASKARAKFKQAEELDKLIDKYERTTDVFKKNQLALEIQKIAPAAVKNFRMVEDAQGKLVKVYDVSIDAARRFEKQQRDSAKSTGEGLPENFLNGIEAQIKLYEDAKEALADLQKQRAEKVALGGNTEDIDKQIEEQVKGIEKMKSEVEAQFGEGVKLGLLKNLPEEGEERLQALRQKFPVVFSQIESDAAKSGVGESLAKALSIKGELDRTGALKKLVEDFRKAGTEAEKSSIAQKIQEQIPEAVFALGTFVDAQGNIQTAYQVDEKAADDYFKAQERALGADAVNNADNFRQQLLLLADQYNALKLRIAETREKLNNSSDSAERAKYRQELIQLTDQANKLGGAIGKTIVEGKKFGFVKGDVKQVGNELGASEEEAQALSEGMGRVQGQTDKATTAAQNLGAAFDEAGKALQEAFDSNVLTILANETEIARLTAEASRNFNNPLAITGITARIEELRKENEKLKSQSKGQAIEIKERAERKEKLEIELGIKDPKKKDKEKAVEGVDFSEELKKITEETTKIIGDIRLAGVENEIEREKALRERAADEAVDQATDNLVKQLEAVDEAIKDKKPIAPLEVVIDGKTTKISDPAKIKDALRRATQDQLNAIRAQESADIARIEQEGIQKKKEALRQVVSEERKAISDSYRQEADALQKRQELIKGNGEEEIRLRAEFRQRQLELERDAATEAALAESDTYLEGYTKLQQLQQQLDEAQTESEREEIRKKIAEQQVALSTTRQQLLQSNAVLLNIQKDFNQKTKENTTTTDREINRIRNLERIAAIKNVAQQEKELALFTLRDKYEEEYQAAVGNAAKQQELTRKFIEDKRKIEEDYLTKTDTLFRVSLNFREALLDVFMTRLERQNKAEIDLEKQKLDIQEKELTDSLNKRAISYKEYSDKIADLNTQRQELEKSGEIQNDNVLIAIRDNTLKVFEKLAEKEVANNQEASKKVIDTGVTTALTREKRERESRENFEKEQEEYQRNLVQSKKSGEEIARALQEKEDAFQESQRQKNLAEEQQAGDARVALLEQSAATIGVELAKLSLKGKVTMADLQSTVFATAFDTIQALTLSYAAPILASATAFLGPVAGPIAAALLTGVVQGLLATTRGALGLKKGRVKIKGPGGPEDDLIPARLSAGESVLTAKATAAGSNASILEWANATGRPIVESPEVQGAVASTSWLSQVRDGNYYRNGTAPTGGAVPPEILQSIHIGRFSTGGRSSVPVNPTGGAIPPEVFGSLHIGKFSTGGRSSVPVNPTGGAIPPEVFGSLHIGRFSTGGRSSVPVNPTGGAIPPEVFGSLHIGKFSTGGRSSVPVNPTGGAIPPEVFGSLHIGRFSTGGRSSVPVNPTGGAVPPELFGAAIPTDRTGFVWDVEDDLYNGVNADSFVNSVLSSGNRQEVAKEIAAMKELATMLKKYNISSSLLPRRFSEGAVAIEGPGTMTSDSIPAMLSFKESVMTGLATMAGGEGPLGNANIFRWVNANGRSILDYPPIRERLAEMPMMPDLDRAALQDVSISMIGGGSAVAEQFTLHTERMERNMARRHEESMKQLREIAKGTNREERTEEKTSGYSITKVTKKVQRARARRG